MSYLIINHEDQGSLFLDPHNWSMKYYVGLVLSLLMVVPLAPSQAAIVANNMNNSKITQNYYFNCWPDECELVMLDNIKGGDDENLEKEGEQNVSEEVDGESTEKVDQDVNEESSETLGQEVNPKDLRINEVVSAPASGENEWVEIYNSLNSSVSLENWWLEEGAGKKTSLFGEIEAGGYLIFETKNLNNSGDVIYLKDSQGKIIDEVVYGDWDDGYKLDNHNAAQSGQSLSFWEDSYVVTSELTPLQANKQTSNQTNKQEINETIVKEVEKEFGEQVEEESEKQAGDTVTEDDDQKVKENVVYDYSDEIRINEFLPDPEGDDKGEWIELWNGSTGAVNLSGWSLDDGDGGSSPYVFENRIIEPNGFLVIDQAESGIILNNSEDEIRLFDPAGKLISEVSYSNPKAGESFARLDNEWQKTDNLTPMAENKVNSKAEEIIENEVVQEEVPLYKTYALSEIQHLELKDKVRVVGVLTVLPGVFGKNYIYMADETGGAQVYFSEAAWPELSIGQEIEITGTISQSYGEKRILMKDRSDLIVSNNQQDVVALEVDSIKDNLVGSLVKIKGKLLEKEGSRLILSNELGEFTVYLKQGTSISTSGYEVGNDLVVKGVVVRNNEELRVQPRNDADIENVFEVNESVEATAAIDEQINGSASTKRKISIGLALAALILFMFQLVLHFSKKISKRNIKKPIYRLREYWQTLKS